MAPGEDEIRAVVTTASRPPDPAKAPYKDCLSQVKVRVTSPSQKLGLAKDADALLVLWLFQDRTPAPGMELRAGHEISARLLPYSAVEASVGQKMRVDETNDFTSPVFWVNSFKITGGTPQPFAEAPAPAPAPAAADEAAGTGAVDRIMRVLAAHRGGWIVDPSTQLVFMLYHTIHTKAFWAIKPPSPPSRTLLAPLEAIRDFNSQLQQRGIRLVMVFPPCAAAVYPDVAANVPWELEKDGRADRYFLQFAAEIKKLGVEVVDVFPELYANRRTEGPDGKLHLIYEARDIHWTPLGAKIAAEKVAERIKSEPWYAARMESMDLPRFVSSQRVTLIPRGQADSSATESAPPIPPALASAITPSPGSPGLAEMNRRDAPIHVIGDSYARWGQEQSSSFCDHLSAATGLPIGRSVVDGSSTTSALAAFARSADLGHIKTVVWEVSMMMAGDGRTPWGRVLLDSESVVFLYDRREQAKFSGIAITAPDESKTLQLPPRTLFADFTRVSAPDPPKPLTASALWTGIKLGDKPALGAVLGLAGEFTEAIDPQSDGVTFSVKVNGSIVFSGEHRRGSWRTIEVELSKFSGQTVDLELCFDSRQNPSQDAAFWVDPQLWDGELPAAAGGGSPPSNSPRAPSANVQQNKQP